MYIYNMRKYILEYVIYRISPSFEQFSSVFCIHILISNIIKRKIVGSSRKKG